MFAARSHARWAVPPALALTAVGSAVPVASATRTAAPVRDDFNGDGYTDLAVGAPNEDGGNGAVWELRGRPTGVTTDAALVFGEKSIGAPYAKAASGFELE